MHELKNSISTVIKVDNQAHKQKNLREIWNLGRKIYLTRERFPYGQKEAMVIALAQDIKANRTDLFQISNFYSSFEKGLPKLYNGEFLTWTHYRLSLAVKNQKERLFYLKYAAKEGLATRYFERAIKADLYQIEQLADSDHPNGLLPLNYSITYTFKSKILQYKDGDTHRFDSDKGFYSRQEYDGRLRGINCSELHGPNPESALESLNFSKKVLSPCPWVLNTTYKPDSFGRVIVDVRYHPVYEDVNKVYYEGYFLNQQLLDLGLAKLAPFKI